VDNSPQSVIWLFYVNRAINYDEKDPFLCHACGFCKYAKFDYTLTGRACCAVDPIESDDDRKKTVGTINSLLEKADRVYKQLIANKPTLEVSTVKKVILNPCIYSLSFDTDAPPSFTVPASGCLITEIVSAH